MYLASDLYCTYDHAVQFWIVMNDLVIYSKITGSVITIQYYLQFLLLSEREAKTERGRQTFTTAKPRPLLFIFLSFLPSLSSCFPLSPPLSPSPFSPSPLSPSPLPLHISLLPVCRENDLLKDQLKLVVQRRDSSLRPGELGKENLLTNPSAILTAHSVFLHTYREKFGRGDIE